MIVVLIVSAISVALPLGLLAAPGDLYVTNLATNTIDVYAPDGAKSTFASGLNSPQGLVFDRGQNLYVADAGSGTIFKYDTAGNQTTFLTGLSVPVGLAIDGKNLLVAESGLFRLITIPLAGGEPQIFLTRDPYPILGVAVGGDTRFFTYSMTLNSESFGSGTFYFFGSNTQGVTTVRRTALDAFDAYVTTAHGEIWRIKPLLYYYRIFATGLSDPNGMAFFQGPGQPAALYVAERGTGDILKFTYDGARSVFVGDAGMPNFLAFEE